MKPVDEKIKEYRFFLKDTLRKFTDFSQTDQNKGVEPPPVEKPYSPEALRIDLPPRESWSNIQDISLNAALANRKSRRKYLEKPLSQEELSFLLWATQGIRGKPFSGHAFRTVPSAGCRHTFETYLALLNVEGLEGGIYRYLPLTHQLLLEFTLENLQEKIIKAAFGQTFVARGALLFIWTTLPYRMEWRYGPASHKVIALDAGHVCQNLYLACEALGAGTCAIAAYDQALADNLVKVDGEDEFVIYMAPVGKV